MVIITSYYYVIVIAMVSRQYHVIANIQDKLSEIVLVVLRMQMANKHHENDMVANEICVLCWNQSRWLLDKIICQQYRF